MTKHYWIAYAHLACIVLAAALVPSLLLPGDLRTVRVTDLLIVAGIAAVALPPVVIWVAQKLGYALGRAVHCSRCSTELPYFRIPASLRQALWGGWQCRNCGASLDARGREQGAHVRHG